MEKINYREQDIALLNGLLRLIKSAKSSLEGTVQVGSVTDPATGKQLGLLSRLGIRPKWKATRQEADELIMHYKLVLSSAKRRPF